MLKRQGSREYPAEVKARVGQKLMAAPRGSQATVAKCLSVTTRTLRSWKARAKKGLSPRKRGRKKEKVTLAELLAIGREWRRQGHVGSRPVIKALPKMRVRLIRDIVSDLKARRRARHRTHVLASRMSVKVNKPGVLVVMDAAKKPVEKGGEIIVCRDRGSLKTKVTEVQGPATCASDTLAVLEELKRQGRLPLVAGSDNGSPFTATEVENFLEENKVVHLRSLPRVPQHNGSAEHAVGDVKGLIRDGKTPEQACQILNHCRKRESLDWQTPIEFDREYFQAYTEEQRDEFFNVASSAIEAAKLGTRTAYEKRKAEREAIFQTMERFSLITRIRGHRPA